jgi:chromate transporter
MRCRGGGGRTTELPENPAESVHASRRDLFITFARIGVSSFGGGVTGWIMQECVRRRRWLSEEEFLTGLAMAQAMPGVNVVNLPIWIGYRLGGAQGAVIAASGVILPSMAVVLAMAAAYDYLSRYHAVNLALQGAAAAAIGMSLAMGLRASRKQFRFPELGALLVLVFIAVGVAHLPMMEAVAVAAPLSVALAYRRVLRDEGRR